MKICTLTDLHFTFEKSINTSVTNICDLVIYVGDIFNFDAITKEQLDQALQFVDDFITQVNKPFLFTLGNHDWLLSMEYTMNISKHIAQHHLHNGTCNENATACYRTEPNIATLYSGTYYCDGTDSGGCPTLKDTLFIEQHLTRIHMLFTHIPPPQVIGVPYVGIQNEQMCGENKICSWQSTKHKLPDVDTDWHGFGHDHNNLFITKSIPKYTNLLKTGPYGYGPNLNRHTPDGGITVFKWGNSVEFENHILLDNSVLDIVPHTHCTSNKPCVCTASSAEKLGVNIYIAILVLWLLIMK